jgi:hypothetical protein
MKTNSALWRTLVATVVAVLTGTLIGAPAAHAAPRIYEIENAMHRWQCLDGVLGNGNPVYIWQCIPEARNQKWTFEFVGNEGFARIRNRKTQMCLRVQNGVHYSAPLVSGPCDNSWDALWKGIAMRTEGYDWYKLTPYYLSGLYCINAPSGVNGSPVGIELCDSIPFSRPTNYWTWHWVG